MLIMKTLIRFLSVCALLSLATSCAFIDPNYQKLLPLAETNPDPEAIVGMWHRKSTDYIGAIYRQSYLFNRDGTGLLAFHSSDFLLGATEQDLPFTWKYHGGGVWKSRFTNGASIELRLSQGKLLRREGFTAFDVLEKIPLQ